MTIAQERQAWEEMTHVGSKADQGQAEIAETRLAFYDLIALLHNNGT